VSKAKQATKMVALGVLSAALYVALFILEEPILEMTSQGKWSFFIPIAIAFAISFAHGAFTGEFWDVLGIKAKK
jgi:lipopolysaccharide export LptBFGC system permease protein LptF